MTTVASRFDLVTIDVPRPDASAAFWCAALGLHEVEREDGDRWVVLADARGVRRIGLQRGAARPGGVHLDLSCGWSEFDDEVGRLLTAGAKLIGESRVLPWGRMANFADPDGYAFDLCAYGAD